MDIGLVLAAAALIAAFVVPFAVEAFERPRLEIIPSPWLPQDLPLGHSRPSKFATSLLLGHLPDS